MARTDWPRHRRTKPALGALSLALVAAGCSSPPAAATRLLVVVSSDLRPGADVDRVLVRSCPGDRDDTCLDRVTFGLTPETAAEYGARDGRPVELPFSFGVRPTAGEASATRVEAVALRGNTVVARAAVRTHFIAGQTAVAAILLERSCAPACPDGLPSVCDEGATCADGVARCVAPEACTNPSPRDPIVVLPDAGADAEFSLVDVLAPGDAAVDTSPEIDAPMDAPRVDAPSDAPTDAPRDVTPDAAPDAPTDAPMDARGDSPADAPTDAPVDAAPLPDVPCVVRCNGRCTDPQTDPYNCGGCGAPCVAATNARATCRMAMCVPSTSLECAPGFGDCARTMDDGCETNLRQSAQHCGACGRACTTAPANAQPVCTFEGGTAHCDFVCSSGFLRSGAGCVAAVRPYYPPSGAVVTGGALSLRWQDGRTGDAVELARSQTDAIMAETRPSTRAGELVVSSALARGAWFWRVKRGRDVVSPWMELFSQGPAPPGVIAGGVSNYRLDLNGDGRTDIARGVLYIPAFIGDVPVQGEQRNGVYVYLARAAGVAPPPAGASLAPDVVLRESRLAESFGLHVSAVGDVDGDGFGDLVASNAAGVSLFVGGPSGPSGAPRSTTRVATSEQNLDGVAPAGDVNSDGFADVAVLLRRDAITVLLGGRDGLSAARAFTLRNAAAADITYERVVGGFDANGDGYADLAASSDATVYCWLTAGSGLSATTPPTVTHVSPPVGEMFDDKVSALAAADVNSDGYADLFVGVDHACVPDPTTPDRCNSEGTVTLYWGGESARALEASTNLGRVREPPVSSDVIFFGSDIATGTDLNNDGVLDFVISASGAAQAQFYLGVARGEPLVSRSLVIRLGGSFPDSVALPSTFYGPTQPMFLGETGLRYDTPYTWQTVAPGSGASLSFVDTMLRTPEVAPAPTWTDPYTSVGVAY